MNVPGHSDSFNRKLGRPRVRPILAKDSCDFGIFNFSLLSRNRVLMPSELRESSPDQAESIQPSPLVDPYATSSVL